MILQVMMKRTVIGWKRWSDASGLLAFGYSACSTGLSKTVSLTNRTAETDVHEALSGGRQRSSSGEHHTHIPTQQRSDFLKQTEHIEEQRRLKLQTH